MGNCAEMVLGWRNFLITEPDLPKLATHIRGCSPRLLSELACPVYFSNALPIPIPWFPAPHTFEFGLKSGFVLTSVLSRCYYLIYWKNTGDLVQRLNQPIRAHLFTRPILPDDCLVSLHFNREIGEITGL